MKGVHGPGPKRGSMDQGSMFCPLPDFSKHQHFIDPVAGLLKSGTGNAFTSQKLTCHVSKTQSSVTKEKHVSFKEIQAVQIQSSFNSIQFKAQSVQNSAIQSSTVII